MEWSKKQTLDLIELLQVQECLWNVKNELYKDRKKRKDALAAIASQININVNDVDKKITNIKNQFNRELNKIRSKSGSGADDIYVSPWYAFKPLCFLRNNNLPNPSRSSDNTSEEHNEHEESNILNTLPLEDYDIPSVSGTSDVSTISERKGLKTLKRIKPSDDRQNEALSILKEARDNIIKRPDKDEFDVFGEYVASELRGVTDKMNILELKKQIQDLIYFTKLKEIKYDSNVSLQPPTTLGQLSESKNSAGENQEMEVAANLVLNSEVEEIYDLRDDTGNILLSFNK